MHEKGGAAPFDRANWEAQMKELAIGGKFLVPNTYGKWWESCVNVGMSEF